MLSLEELQEPKPPSRSQSAPPARRRGDGRGKGGQWTTPLLLPQEAVPPPAAGGPARVEPEEECAVFGLSTTVANERLVEQIEAVVGEFLALVKVVTWRARLSFLQTQEGAIAPLVVLALVVFAAVTGDTWLVGEVLLILPFHLLAWYISFRLPRAEQLRAIAKVQDCVQRFVTSDDAFTQTGAAPYDPMPMEAVPPSAVCVSVLRDRIWRQLPYNMVVEGDVFKLREGETFPCQAERLIMRPQGAVPSGQVLRAGDVFAPGGATGEDPSVPVVGSFRARTTACVPMVRKFLQSAQRSSAGRMDTVFFELATLVRGRLKKLSLTAFVFTGAASGLWLLQPAVMEQSTTWHLHRFLLPLRLVLCLLPLLPAILLQVTDIWGNARIQSLFQWHAGLSDEERTDGAKPKGRFAESCEDEQSLGSGDLDASRVPLQWQLRELFEILGQGLEGQANLMHTLNSTTVVCFCDREGLLTDTCTSVAEVCLCSSRRPRKHSVISEGACSHSRAPSEIEEEQRTQLSERRSLRSPSKRETIEGIAKPSCEQTPATPQERAESSKAGDNEDGDVTFTTVVLDVQSDSTSACGLRFEDADWRNYLPHLKPLGLSMAVSRQPREPSRSLEGPELFQSMAGDLLRALHRSTSAAMHDCSCNMSQLIGFRDDVVASFSDVKFCMEFCRPHKLQALPPHQRSENSMAAEARLAEASPNTVATQARPHMAWRAAPSPQSASDGPSPLSDPRGPPVMSAISKSSQETGNVGEEIDSTRRADEEVQAPHVDAAPDGPTNFSQTLLSWFVEDPRDGSYQMFCKGKPKRLLPRCTHYFDGHEVLPLTEADKQCLTRLVLQWKASGLTAVAYSYRPLSSQAEIDIPIQLEKNTFFCATEDDEGSFKFVQAGVSEDAVLEKSPATASSGPRARARLAQAWKELQSEQVLLGMAGAKLCASVQMPSYAEALQTAGIRFQVYSVEGEKRTRTLGSQLGLETGWNCLISLEPNARQVKNMMGQVVLPSGIAKIRRHVKEVDNVPLLVSLYSKATPWRAQQMISIMQEHAECVTCVGSALQPNFEIFRQASISVSVLVNSVPQCRRCYGRRAPRPAGSAGSDELLVNNMVNRAEFQLSADLTSLPCALQARHSFSNGEQRTLEVLFNAIKEARRCVDCILMVLIHYICGAVELAIIVSLQSLLCLPPPMEGFHVLGILLLLLPMLSVCLLFNAASPQIMKELPLKKADEKTLAQPGRLMLLYALRSVPSALVVAVAFLQDLHLLFSSHLQRALASPSRPEKLAEMCQGFSWTWWLTGRWPRCAKAVHEAAFPAAAPFDSLSSWEHGSCTLSHAQQWSAWLFVLYEVTLAFTFLDRYDSLVTRGPSSNKVLNSVALVTLLLHLAVSCSIVLARCEDDRPESLVPSVQQWLLYVALWPVLAVLVSEGTKRRDRRYHMHLQKTLRVLFNTRLGMWSPK